MGNDRAANMSASNREAYSFKVNASDVVYYTVLYFRSCFSDSYLQRHKIL